jgi:hypothetical protein
MAGKLEEGLEAARALVAELEGKRERASKELERLERCKEPLVLPAAAGDQAKQRRLDKLNQSILEQQLRIGDLGAAIGQAQAQALRIETELGNAADVGLAEELAGRHGELLEADAEIDRLLTELAGAFKRRLELIVATERLMDRGTMARLGMDEMRSDFGWSTKTKGPGTRAARAVGLEAYLDLPWVGRPGALSETPSGRSHADDWSALMFRAVSRNQWPTASFPLVAWRSRTCPRLCLTSKIPRDARRTRTPPKFR